MAGAVYKIYSDASCTTEVGSLTTDANGKAATGDESYDAGTYYIKGYGFAGLYFGYHYTFCYGCCW